MNPITWILTLIQHLKHFLSQRNQNLYSLDHAILNIQLPPPSLWMNMGYWKNETTLSGACQALLDQVLITAGLLSPDGRPISHPPHRRFHLLDVGIGCGDQSLYLTRCQRLSGSEGSGEPLFDTYTGITLVAAQAEIARQRIESTSASAGAGASTPARIFTGDASDPTSWPTSMNLNQPPAETWILALDTLYHFRPSRVKLVQHAGRERASLMAFDLLLGETSWWERLMLRLVCWVSGVPFGNLLTRDEYEAMLVRAGYALEGITVRDISDHVFGGLAGFLARRDAELRRFGMGVGKFRAARVVFDWWARSGVVRGVVVVARAPSMER